jgi:serine/threonine-protein kinase HipA
LIYRDSQAGTFTTTVTPGFEAGLVKFPAREEHAEACAIEMVYSECLRICGIQTPGTQYFSLPNGMRSADAQAAIIFRRYLHFFRVLLPTIAS